MNIIQTKLGQNWKDWITLNLFRGCNKHEVIHILLDHSFAPVDIIEALKNHPDLQTLKSIVNQKSLFIRLDSNITARIC
jgi:hypothetical protein